MTIFISGVLIYRLTSALILDPLVSNQVIRSRMSYEMNQDLHNLIQDCKKIKNDRINSSAFGLRKATSAQFIRDPFHNSPTGFINHLEAVIAEHAAYKAIKYQFNIHKEFYRKELSPTQKSDVIDLLYKAFEYWTYIYPMKIELEIDTSSLLLSFDKVKSDFFTKLKTDGYAVHLDEASKVTCRIITKT